MSQTLRATTPLEDEVALLLERYGPHSDVEVMAPHLIAAIVHHVAQMLTEASKGPIELALVPGLWRAVRLVCEVTADAS